MNDVLWFIAVVTLAIACMVLNASRDALESEAYQLRKAANKLDELRKTNAELFSKVDRLEKDRLERRWALEADELGRLLASVLRDMNHCLRKGGVPQLENRTVAFYAGEEMRELAFQIRELHQSRTQLLALAAAFDAYKKTRNGVDEQSAAILKALEAIKRPEARQ